MALAACRKHAPTKLAGLQQLQSADEAAQPQNEVADASSLVSAKEERDLQVLDLCFRTFLADSARTNDPPDGSGMHAVAAGDVRIGRPGRRGVPAGIVVRTGGPGGAHPAEAC